MTNGIRAGWWVLMIASVLIVSAGLSTQASAQRISSPTGGPPPAGFYVTPSLGIREEYDDNVFFTPQGNSTSLQPSPIPGEPPILVQNQKKTGDFVFISEPGILAGYRSAPFSLLAGYQIGANVYTQQSDLDAFPSSQTASLLADYLPDPRLDLNVTGGYNQSQNPAQLNTALVTTQAGLTPTGIQNGRSRSELYYAGAGATYELTALNKILASYGFSHTHQVGAGANTEHSVNAGFSHRFTETDEGDLGYVYRHFDSSQPEAPIVEPTETPSGISIINPASTVDSNAVTVGWTHRFSELTEVVVRGGPRFTGSNIDPEAFASITRTLAHGKAGFGYRNSQTSAVGVTSALNVQTFMGDLSYDLGQSLTAGIALALYKTSSEGSSSTDTDVYSAGLTARYRVLEWLSIILAYDFTYQKGVFSTLQTPESGTVTVVNNNQDVYRNVVSIGLEAAEPFRLY